MQRMMQEKTYGDQICPRRRHACSFAPGLTNGTDFVLARATTTLTIVSNPETNVKACIKKWDNFFQRYPGLHLLLKKHFLNYQHVTFVAEHQFVSEHDTRQKPSESLKI
jgi:hypothetical protein